MATATITPDQNALIAEIFIAAPPGRVFRAISDPNQLPQWWGQAGLYHLTKSTMDVRPGGKWRSDGTGADGQPFYVEGEYLEVDPPRLLVRTWIGSYSGPLKTVVGWELEPHSVHGLHPSAPRNPALEPWCASVSKDSRATWSLRPATAKAGNAS